MTLKTDLYAQVTDKIIEALESGNAPWVRPWGSTWRDRTSPYNGATGHQYKGVNILILWAEMCKNSWSDPRFYTYAQASQRGGQVRKGEKAVHVTFFKPLKVPMKDSSDEEKTIPLLRSFAVFNRAQVEWADEVFPAEEPVASDPKFEAAEALLAWSGAIVRHGGDRAYYDVGRDSIQLPEKASFTSQSAYWGTALHELTHWSGASTRLSRTFGKRFGDDAYAMEELVAELGAAFLCASTGVVGHLQHPEYISQWLRVLGNDKRAIFTAAREAQKAADYLTAPSAEKAPAQANETEEFSTAAEELAFI